MSAPCRKIAPRPVAACNERLLIGTRMKLRSAFVRPVSIWRMSTLHAQYDLSDQRGRLRLGTHRRRSQ